MENNHVKSNLTSLLQRIRMLGNLELKDFKPLLIKEFKVCLESKSLQKTWYLVTLDVFISFLFRVHFFVFCFVFFQILVISTFSFFVLSDLEGDLCCGGCGGGGYCEATLAAERNALEV